MAYYLETNILDFRLPPWTMYHYQYHFTYFFKNFLTTNKCDRARLNPLNLFKTPIKSRKRLVHPIGKILLHDKKCYGKKLSIYLHSSDIRTHIYTQKKRCYVPERYVKEWVTKIIKLWSNSTNFQKNQR